MATDTKKLETAVRRLYDEVYTKGNLKLIDELVAPNLKFHDAAAGKNGNGLELFKKSETSYFKAFPHKKATIDDLIVSGNKVVVRWTCQGKHEGEFHGIAPTHRPFNITGVSIYLFTNDKITEIWQSWDRQNLFEQLGVAAPAHALR